MLPHYLIKRSFCFGTFFLFGRFGLFQVLVFFFKGGFVEIRPWDSSTNLTENRAIISTQSPFTLSWLLYRFHLPLFSQHLNCMCSTWTWKQYLAQESVLLKNFNLCVRNLNFTLILTGRKITFFRNKLSRSVEESIFFIPVFLRKPDTYSKANNSEI